MTNEALALKGQVALVAGASSGLGQATALALAQSGADVVLLARSGDDLQDVATKISQGGRRALALPGDLAHDDYIVNAVERAVTTFGRIDVLVNAAGIDVPGAVVQLTTSDWDYVLAVNLRAPFLLAKAVFPHMSQAGEARSSTSPQWQANGAGPMLPRTALPSSVSRASPRRWRLKAKPTASVPALSTPVLWPPTGGSGLRQHVKQRLVQLSHQPKRSLQQRSPH